MKLRPPKLFARAIDPEGMALLGFTWKTGQPIFGPKGHSQLLSANGGGKTTCGAVPMLISLIASSDRGAILCLDSKNGEIAAQLVPMLAKLGVPVAVIDDMNVLPELAEHRVSLNAFGAAVATYERDPSDLVFTLEKITNTLIEEPTDGDAKNKHWRDVPRDLLEFVKQLTLKRNPLHATPGACALILSDPDMLLSFAQIEAEEGSPALQDSARAVLAAAKSEHWAMHLKEAQRAVRLFAPGTRLHEAGTNATLTHHDLIVQKGVIFLVGPQAHMSRLGAYYALHIMAFTDALFNGAGPLDIIADEFTNCPLKPLVSDVTTMRAFGGALHQIAQSRSEIVRKFGENETRTLEENSIVKQWFGFSSIEEAERVSKAMGEEYAISKGMSGAADGFDANINLNPVKQPHMSPAELMAMPRNRQLIHVKGVGFFVARTVSQEQIAPFNRMLAPNPLEGGILKPETKITLTTPKVLS